MRFFTAEELITNTNMDTIVFNSKSSITIHAGYARCEFVNETLVVLEKFPEFRRMLSNFFPCIIKDGDKTYPSAEHMFHAKKAELIDPKYAKLFEVGNKFGILEPKFMPGKTGKNKKTGLSMGSKIEYWDRMSDGVLEEIWTLKFSQDPDLKAMLKATGNARLVHMMRNRGQATRYQHWESLERIRDKL